MGTKKIKIVNRMLSSSGDEPLLFFCHISFKIMKIALKTRVNPTSTSNLLHFAFLRCIFALAFEELTNTL